MADQDIVKLSNGGVRLVHEDAACVVADKPAGLLCVPGRGEDKQDCLAARVQSLFADALVVHRLDMATSGLCLFARGGEVQRRLSRAFAERQVGKTYVAVVAGRPAQDAGEIDLPLLADWPNRPRQKIDQEHGKPSRTRWRVLGPGPMPGSTRVELEPVTGRSHQLRVHLLAIGHPILGDTLYAPAGIAAAAPRLLLHAQTLELAHPLSGEPMRWHAPAPF
ncbi:RluA family pseudouridine synthase [Ramlibacter humi]|uniref:RNA pseudouridine synthase n=1 Tax=Ramlibacter humi TaxID=2530451 RepID=A0A4Z0BGL3_9BURK|nr:pseudouridine synthase [Ramlibacter humi]TFY97593.1 RNA pseudouridine synthase [Ramlibacter humi]